MKMKKIEKAIQDAAAESTKEQVKVLEEIGYEVEVITEDE